MAVVVVVVAVLLLLLLLVLLVLLGLMLLRLFNFNKTLGLCAPWAVPEPWTPNNKVVALAVG